MAITGRCLCGSVRYRIDSEPIVTRLCWCRDCQKFGAGSATVNAMFPANAVQIEGPLKDFESIAASGNRMHRGFCLNCGVGITTGSEVRPHLLGIRAGTLDDPSIATPDITIWTGSAPPWAVFDPSIPQEEGQPALPEPSNSGP